MLLIGLLNVICTVHYTFWVFIAILSLLKIKYLVFLKSNTSCLHVGY